MLHVVEIYADHDGISDQAMSLRAWFTTQKSTHINQSCNRNLLLRGPRYPGDRLVNGKWGGWIGVALVGGGWWVGGVEGGVLALQTCFEISR